jgi:hypothetical protein
MTNIGNKFLTTAMESTYIRVLFLFCKSGMFILQERYDYNIGPLKIFAWNVFWYKVLGNNNLGMSAGAFNWLIIKYGQVRSKWNLEKIHSLFVLGIDGSSLSYLLVCARKSELSCARGRLGTKCRGNPNGSAPRQSASVRTIR